MTKEELSRLFYLSKEIKEEKQLIRTLREKAEACTTSSSGLPSAGGISDKTGIAAEIADCEAAITAKTRLSVIEYNRLIRYIHCIEDPMFRMIFTARHVYGMSWLKVAASVGGNNTEDSVRKAHDRFLRKL